MVCKTSIGPNRPLYQRLRNESAEDENAWTDPDGSPFGSAFREANGEPRKLVIPPIGFVAINYVACMGLLLVLGAHLAIVGAFSTGQLPVSALLGYGGVILAVLIALSGRIRRRVTDQQLVEFGPDEIRIAARGEAVSLRPSDVLDVKLQPVGERREGYSPLKTIAAGTLYVRGPNQEIDFGHPLSGAQLRQLSTAIQEHILAHSPSMDP